MVFKTLTSSYVIICTCQSYRFAVCWRGGFCFAKGKLPCWFLRETCTINKNKNNNNNNNSTTTTTSNNNNNNSNSNNNNNNSNNKNKNKNKNKNNNNNTNNNSNSNSGTSSNNNNNSTQFIRQFAPHIPRTSPPRTNAWKHTTTGLIWQGIAFLLANHLYLVGVNMTTNEMVRAPNGSMRPYLLLYMIYMYIYIFIYIHNYLPIWTMYILYMAGVQNSWSKGLYKVGPIGIEKLILHHRYEAGPIGNDAVHKLGASIALA